MKPTAQHVIRAAQKLADKKRAMGAARYFKTGPGQYGEGDIFWGLTVPQSRSIAKQYAGISFEEIRTLLCSPIHELRLIALLILVAQYLKCEDKKPVVDFYLKNLRSVNNWDLVDLSAHKILGDWFLDKPTTILKKLSQSKNLWERRIAVLACFPRITHNDFALSLEFAKKLLNDQHDLMHKAVGWMLREMGKKSAAELRRFLDRYAPRMPRTMLRYAIEKFPEPERKSYLCKKE